ncbi:MAG: T9SS type A sorting domain-containing protein [Bacteroidota bacterium]
MKQILTTTLCCLLGLLASLQVDAQCRNEGGTRCSFASPINCVPTTIYTQQERADVSDPFPGCPSFALDNPSWYSIDVISTVLGIRAVPSCANGTGFQMALYADCNPTVPPLAVQCGCTTGPVFMEVSNITPGTYYILVDGCGGDVCDIDIELTRGSLQGASVVLDPLFPPLATSDNVCPGEFVSLEVNPIAGAEFYNWSFPPGVTVLNTDCNAAQVVWGSQGGAVTVTAGSFCLGQTVTSPPTIIDVPTFTTDIFRSYCTEDLAYYFPELDIFFPAGFYEIPLLSARGCDSLLRLTVEELTSPLNTIEQTLCPGESIVIDGTIYDSPINTLLTLTDATSQNCDSTILLILDVASELVLEEQIGDAQCDVCNGFIDVSVSGGILPYQFTWSNGTNGEDVSGLCAGNYQLTVTDNNGCTVVQTYTVNNEAGTELAITALTNSPDCPGGCDGSLMLNIACGTPPYSIDWEDGLPDDNTILGNLCSDVYEVTVTDATGLTGSTAIVINDPMPISINPSVTNISCFGASDGSISLSPFGGTPPYSYRWSDLTLGNFASRTNLAAGTYTAEITDANDCVAELTISITEPSALSLSIEAVNVTCAAKGSATATVDGGTTPYSYAWSNSASTASIDELEFGTYGLTVTDANGCTISQEFEIIDECCELAISLTATDIPCDEGEIGTVTVNIDVEGTPPYAIEWSNPNLPKELTLTDLPPGVYAVTLTDATGCQVSGDAEVLAECCPEDFTLEVMDESCRGINDGSINVNIGNPVTPPYSFEWSDPNLPNESQLSDLLAGDYSLTLTNGEGCSKVETFSIASSLNLEVTTTFANCEGDGGSATATADGFFLNFFWSNGGSGASQFNLSVGDYSVTVFNLFGGCRSGADFTIEEDPACPDDFVVAPNVATVKPEALGLSMQVSPNPTKGQGQIRYTLEEATAVTLELYDLQGRRVRQLERAQPHTAGYHEVDVDLSDLESGTYMVSLSTAKGQRSLLPWVKIQ